MFKESLSLIRSSKSHRRAYWSQPISNFELPLFVAAVSLAGPEIPTLLYETWPIATAILLAAIKWGSNVNPRRLALAGTIAVVGIVLASLSRDGISESYGLALGASTVTGVGLALLCSLCGAVGMVGALHLGNAANGRTADSGAPQNFKEGLQAAHAPSMMRIIGMLPILPILLIAAFVHDGTLSFTAFIAAAAGGLFAAPGGYLTRAGNMLKHDPSKNIWMMISPCASILWLWLFLGFEIQHPSLFFIGGAAILFSGILTQKRPSAQPA